MAGTPCLIFLQDGDEGNPDLTASRAEEWQEYMAVIDVASATTALCHAPVPVPSAAYVMSSPNLFSTARLAKNEFDSTKCMLQKAPMFPSAAARVIDYNPKAISRETLPPREAKQGPSFKEAYALLYVGRRRLLWVIDTGEGTTTITAAD